MQSGSDTPTSGNSRQNRSESAPALAKDAENGPAATSAAVSTASSTSRGSRLASAPDPSETLVLLHTTLHHTCVRCLFLTRTRTHYFHLQVHFHGRPFTAAEDFAARWCSLLCTNMNVNKNMNIDIYAPTGRCSLRIVTSAKGNSRSSSACVCLCLCLNLSLSRLSLSISVLLCLSFSSFLFLSLSLSLSLSLTHTHTHIPQVFKGMRRTTQIRLNCDPSEIRL